jgi:hypothetical protein
MRPIETAALDSHRRPRLAGRRSVRQGRRHWRDDLALTASGASSLALGTTSRPARRSAAAHHVPRARHGSERIAQGVLVVVRIAMGLLFFACGLRGILSVAPQGVHVQQGALTFGGALLLTGALLPLLKGSEVLVETALELQRALGARRAGNLDAPSPPRLRPAR